MIDEPTIATTDDQHIAYIHITVDRDKIAEAMDPAFAELFGVIGAQGLQVVGAPLSHHYRIEPGVFDFDLAVPVASPVAPSGRVRSGVLPSRTVVRTYYRGDYAGLGAAWGAFDQWLGTSGHVKANDLWEIYLKGPESDPDPSTWVTELVRPLVV
jgi:effector-binding domain-containing protein